MRVRDYKLECRRSDSPARPFRKQYVIRMLPRHSLHELDAGEVLPVSHRLLEQGLVRAGEITIDLVRDHAVIPHAFLTRGGRATHPARKRVPRCATLVRQVFRLVLHVVELDRTDASIVQGDNLVRDADGQVLRSTTAMTMKASPRRSVQYVNVSIPSMIHVITHVSTLATS